MGRSGTLFKVKGAIFLSPSQLPPPPYLLSPPNNVVGSGDSNVKDSVSPSVLLIIIILAIAFFVSGLLHLLVRYLWRPQTRDPDDLDDDTVLQGQLQQLFNLHDSGVDQSFIDTLPVFLYKAIIGLKNPFDCAVCLSEFEPEDKLQLLPKCSHAFHMECIDTWLLSHSTCPICRACLLNDFSSTNDCSPIVLVLSDNNSTEIIAPETDETGSRSTRFDSNNHDSGEGVVTVKLGKIRNVDSHNGEGSSSVGDTNDNAEARRCFSMGSFSYVMDESTLLHVPIRARISKSNTLRLTTGNRLAMSDCDCESGREFRFSDSDENRVEEEEEEEEAANFSRCGVITRKESLSVSKIWLSEKKDRRINGLEDSSRRAVSFRFPLQRNVDGGGGGDLKQKNGKLESRSTISEMDITKWEDSGGWSEFGYDDENQSCNSVDSQAIRAPSFARRTLLWLTGKQNKVVHSSSASSGDL